MVLVFVSICQGSVLGPLFLSLTRKTCLLLVHGNQRELSGLKAEIEWSSAARFPAAMALGQAMVYSEQQLRARLRELGGMSA